MTYLLRLVACLFVLLSFNAKANEYFPVEIFTIPDNRNINTQKKTRFAVDSNQMILNNLSNCSSESEYSINIYQKENGVWSLANTISQNNYDYGCSSYSDGIDIHGDWIAVGAASSADVGGYTGAVYIYKNELDTWSLQGRITAGDISPGSWFGSNLKFSDGSLFVSAPHADHSDGGSSTSNVGAIYVFEKVENNWSQVQKLTPPSNYLDFDSSFGVEFSVSGTTIAVSQPNCSLNNCGYDGVVHMYSKNNGIWELVQTINDPLNNSNADFGSKLALSGNNLLVRSYSENQDQKVYYYKRESNGNWSYEADVWGSRTFGFRQTYFDYGYGDNIELMNDIALITSSSSVRYGGSRAPLAYLFKLNSEDEWEEQALLINNFSQFQPLGSYILTPEEVIEDSYRPNSSWQKKIASYDLNQIILREVSIISGDINGLGSPLSNISGDLNATDLNGLTDGTYYTICSIVNDNLGIALIQEESGAWTFIANSEEGVASFDVCVTDDIGDVTRQTIIIQITDDDTDSDTIGDTKDNCPSISNTNQDDLDFDGTGDACDNDADGDGFTSDNDYNDLNAYLSTDPDNDGIDSSGTSHYSDNICLRSPQCNENDPCITVCYVPPQDNCPDISNADQANLDNDNEGDACDLDIDGDKIINTIETAAGTNPNDPSDGDQAELSALEALGINKQVPAMGGIGLLALGLSMLGLGAVRLRRK